MSDGSPSPASRMFQIHEEDLAELERLLPSLTNRLWPTLANRDRVQIRRVKDIISNVRWNYGPPGECSEIPG